MPNPICFRLFRHCVRRAFSRAELNAGMSIPAKMAIIAITTNNSINVKPLIFFRQNFFINYISHGLFSFNLRPPLLEPAPLCEQVSIYNDRLREPTTFVNNENFQLALYRKPARLLTGKRA